ncbi:MAG: aspartate kinase [Planctomycetota bacterium]|jgi:aspartate kinase
MDVAVQKFGGTSVADPVRVLHCAGLAVARQRDDRGVVVVVSAMGDTTDRLLDLARQVSARPGEGELDALLATGEQVSAALMTMAIREHGAEATCLTGPLLGITTTGVHGRARIEATETDRLQRELTAGRIVVVPGFQGITRDGRTTTLGRGGSDITAVALAAALGVSPETGTCEIFTDVDGVYTADPRCAPSARKLARITYDEMLELASMGAGVLHSRAVVFGRQYHVPIHVRHHDGAAPGTMIVTETPDMETFTITGCALTPDVGRISLTGLPRTPGVQAAIFAPIARAEVLVDDIMQTESERGADISFTVEIHDVEATRLAAEQTVAELQQGEVAVETGLAKVSVVGVGMRSHAGVAALMFKGLGDAGIKIDNITTSEIKISCIVPRDQGEQALRAVHDAFGLERSPLVESIQGSGGVVELKQPRAGTSA